MLEVCVYNSCVDYLGCQLSCADEQTNYDREPHDVMRGERVHPSSPLSICGNSYERIGKGGK